MLPSQVENVFLLSQRSIISSMMWQTSAICLFNYCLRRDIPSFLDKNVICHLPQTSGTAATDALQTHHLSGNLRVRLDQAMTSATESFKSFQRHYLSCQVMLQNTYPQDIIIVKHERNAWYQKECCSYVNKSDTVKTNANTRNILYKDMLSKFQPQSKLAGYITLCFLVPYTLPVLWLSCFILMFTYSFPYSVLPATVHHYC